MSYYEKVIKSLSEVKTLSSHMTALGKIKVATEDDELVKGINLVIQELQRAHANSKTKSTPISLDRTKRQEINTLLNGCKKRVGIKKPEWQIMAERNNWVPKI